MFLRVTDPGSALSDLVQPQSDYQAWAGLGHTCLSTWIPAPLLWPDLLTCSCFRLTQLSVLIVACLSGSPVLCFPFTPACGLTSPAETGGSYRNKMTLCSSWPSRTPEQDRHLSHHSKQLPSRMPGAHLHDVSLQRKPLSIHFLSGPTSTTIHSLGSTSNVASSRKPSQAEGSHSS